MPAEKVPDACTGCSIFYYGPGNNKVNDESQVKKVKQTSVIMYSASWCGVCTKARSFMTKEGIAFVEKDVDKDKAAAKELAEKSRRSGTKVGGVPVFDIGGKIVAGFDPTALKSAAAGSATR